MEVLIICITSLLILILSIIFYILFFKSEAKSLKRRLVLLFIDAPDPDNPAAAVAIAKHILTIKTQDNIITDPHLHVILTGRPVNLKTPKAFKGPPLIRQTWEGDDPIHSRRLLEDAAARLENYLVKCNIHSSMVTIYDGGVAQCAPLSDQFHDWDFLFDRKDLVSGQEVDVGTILSPVEYQTLVEKFNILSEEEREHELLTILRSYPLALLSDLRHKLEEESCANILLFLGGPATAVVQLFGLDQGGKIYSKVTELYGMFGALEPGKGTLLLNQFNVACDVESACDLFVNNLLPRAEKYLITTETAKNNIFRVSSDELQALGICSDVVNLQRLWEFTHVGNPQPLFDVLPVMAYLCNFRECFDWSRKKAVLQEWRKKGEITEQIFYFTESDDQKYILVSGAQVKMLDRHRFLEFLQKMWTDVSVQ